MRHFERESYLQWLVPGIMLAVALLSGLLCARPAIRAARVDACLDSGGSYDYEREECDTEKSRPGP